MLAENILIDNKYRILDEIDRGGMSIVYRATVERSGKIWAVKEARKDGTNDYRVVKQNLIAEIETLKQVKHPKLPEIADVIDREDSFIIVMDYIEGVSLDKIISKKGPQSEEKVVDWAKQLCEVLGYLHSKDIIYRDMKPSNIMLKKNGEITIIDFGTAKKYEYNADETTGLGTAGFAAPEQYGGHGRTDARTDIFCLGMTLYMLLTGIDPQKEFIPETSIRKVNPVFSSGLDYIILKCTDKNPDKRYQSCAELLYDLENYKSIDEKSRKKKIIKFSAFLTVFSLSVISILCGCLSGLQANKIRADNYQELLRDADSIKLNLEDENYSENYAQKISLYEQAIAVPHQAGKKEAYLGLMEAYIKNDGFLKEEEQQIRKLIGNNREALKENKEDYIEVCYQLGNLFWYHYNDTNQLTRAIYAAEWFDIVETETEGEESNYDAEKIHLAKAYRSIGDFYDKYDIRVQQMTDSGTYKELLDNLETLMDEITEDYNKLEVVRLEVLEMTRYALYRYATDFKRDGVKEFKLMALYNRIETALKNMEKMNESIKDESHPLFAKKSEIESHMPDTKTAIQNAYETTRKESKSS